MIEGFRPIVDTIRFQLTLSERDRLKLYDRATHAYAIAEKTGEDESGRSILDTKYEKFRIEQTYSWWGKMRFLPSRLLDQKGRSVGECVDVEYSYHKWFGITNALNYTLPNTFAHIWEPIGEALYKYGISKRAIKIARDLAVMRRVDLSVNYKVSGCLVGDVLKTFSRMSLQYQDAPRSWGKNASESVMWGTSNSAFCVKAYDKYLEQHNYHKQRDTHPDRVEWWFNNKDSVNNTLRFEVGFRPRWWNAITDADRGHPMKSYKGEQNDKIISLASEKVSDIWLRINGQIGMENASFQERYSLADLERSIETSDLTFPEKAQAKMLAVKALGHGWKSGKSLFETERTFYRYKKILKEKFHWDIKIKSATYVPVDATTKTKRVDIEEQNEVRIIYTRSTDTASMTLGQYFALPAKTA